MRPETTRKRLSVVLSFGEPCTGEQFALEAYGDSDAWERSRTILGGASGVLGRLKARGLVGRTPVRHGGGADLPCSGKRVEPGDGRAVARYGSGSSRWLGVLACGAGRVPVV